MLNNIINLINKLKKETNNNTNIIYREKYINNNKIYIIFNEPLTSSDKISDFVIKSLNTISKKRLRTKELLTTIKNDLSNFKIIEIFDYDELCNYLHKGYTIILLENSDTGIALETKSNIHRNPTIPDTEHTVRGAKDSFVEDFQINVGLIRKRLKTNDLWIKEASVGRITNTQIGIVYINGIVKKELVKRIYKNINMIDIDGIVNSEHIKNLIEKENKSTFPTIATSERPDVVCRYLLEGKVIIIVENSPYVLIIPSVLNDFFKTTEDVYGKSINVSFTRIIKYISFYISLLAPAVFIALVTHNQETVPTELLVNFAIQRDGVPFPAFIEAFLLILAFEILKECDLRIPSFLSSSLSTVGALILGEAAVNAGIVSPIMIIVVAITSICSLPFNEIDFINALRVNRIIFMLGASTFGIVGIVVVFILFIINISSLASFGTPFLSPYMPISITGLKDSIIRLPNKYLNKRMKNLSNNIIKQRKK